jgi:Lysyl oxidase
MLAGALLVALTLGVRTPASHAGDAAPLPDLDQEVPSQLLVAPSGSRDQRAWWLGFGSAVSNIGAGPLVINGHRPNRRSPAMVADQLLAREGQAPDVIPGVGRLRFVRSPDHNHWHLMKFERYELRPAGDEGAIVRDRKSGFCLGDRYAVGGPSPPAAPAEPVYTSQCGLGQTDLLQLTEGISVGYGDNYAPYLEFQQLPLDRLSNGRYVLVHRVNVRGRLRETSLSNNAASVLLSVRWHRDRPRIRLLRSCPDTARCDEPGAIGTEPAPQRATVPTRSRRPPATGASGQWLCDLR